jgi:hypothetical protein
MERFGARYNMILKEYVIENIACSKLQAPTVHPLFCLTLIL